MERVWRKGKPLTLLMGMQIDTVTVENTMKVILKKIKKNKTRTTIWPSNSTTGPIAWENHNSKWYTYPDVHCSNIYNSQDVEATSTPTNRGMNKEDVNAYNGTLLSHKKEWDNAICSNIDRLRDCHTELSQRKIFLFFQQPVYGTLLYQL